MNRSFDFSDEAKAEIWSRQRGRCAACAGGLSDLVRKQLALWNAHHVIPHQTPRPPGPPRLPVDSPDNGVYLCSNCHALAHQDGNFRTGIVFGPEQFRYSHGPSPADIRFKHRPWRDRINAEWDRCARRTSLARAAVGPDAPRK